MITEPKEIELKSGAKLVIPVGSLREAGGLRQEFLKSLRGIPLNINVMQMDVSVLKEAFLNMATSAEFEQQLFNCMKRSTYNGVKISAELFDDPVIGMNVRQDYYLICWHILEVNVLPFFKQAFSELLELRKTPPTIQK